MVEAQECHYCSAVMKDDWNLFPIGADEDNTTRLYEWDKVICDDCYDHHCTNYNIQPLEGE